MQTWLWLAFFASFAVKMPMWPVHTGCPTPTWKRRPQARSSSPGILLKMGGYGFLRFSLPMFPEASATFAPLVFALSVVAIVATSLIALVQQDMKKLIAYSSVAHMGFVTMGIFTFTQQGVDGAIFQMLSHGLISSALFLCVGVVYDRLHTREISAYGGLVERMPIYAAIFLVFTMGNVGLPGTSGFVGEFLTLLASFKINTYVAVIATSGVILSAALRALSLSARRIRRVGEAVAQGHDRRHAARDPHSRPAGPAYASVRVLPRARSRRDRGVRQSARDLARGRRPYRRSRRTIGLQ